MTNVKENQATQSPVMDAVAKLVRNPALSYAQIAEKVRSEVPGATTSARSVASEVMLLRKGGVEVPQRRRGPVPTSAQSASA